MLKLDCWSPYGMLGCRYKQTHDVITSPITFVASSNAVLYCNANRDFADINSETINICTDALEQTIHNNPKTKAIIPVHFAGVPCDMKKFNKLASKTML